MKLLIVTQTLDSNDPVLGFFANWVSALATHTDSVVAIALGIGAYAPPPNVTVHSLGKEKKERSSLEYAISFLNLVWRERKNYDTVLVHMNQEYVLLAGFIWFLMGKRVYMWRNHYAGSFLTDIAAMFCKKVFYTSRHSYTAQYEHAVQMPVGVDLERFSDGHTRIPHSVLFFGRVAPSKRPEVLVGALELLDRKGVKFSASFVGSPLPKDEGYYSVLKERAYKSGLKTLLAFRPGVPNHMAGDIYRAHDVYVNTSPSGMFDKTIFEAAASGTLVVATSDDWKELAGDMFWCEANAESLAERLEGLLSLSLDERAKAADTMRVYAEQHSLSSLAKVLTDSMRAV